MGKAHKRLGTGAFNLQHPRDNDGRFIEKGQLSALVSKHKAGKTKLGASIMELLGEKPAMRAPKSAREALKADGGAKPADTAESSLTKSLFGKGGASDLAKWTDQSWRDIPDEDTGPRQRGKGVRDPKRIKAAYESQKDLFKEDGPLMGSHEWFRQRAEAEKAASAPKPRKARDALKGKPDPAAAMAEIDALVANPKTEADRARVKALLGGMTLPQIKQVADRHHNGLMIGANKDEKVRRLADSIVGGKLDSAAIARGISDPHGGLGSTGPAKKSARARLSGKANLERLMGGPVQPGEFGSKVGGGIPKADSSPTPPGTAPNRRRTRDMPDALVHDIERDVRAAHLATVSQPGRNEWSYLSEWRGPLDAKYGRADVDAVLVDLSAGNSPDPGFITTGEANQKVLTQAQRAGAVSLGGQDNHLLSLRGSQNPAEPKLVPRPPVAPAKTGKARAALSGKQPVNMYAVTGELEKLRANPQRGDREKVAVILAPLKGKDLDQLAADNGWQIRGTVPQKREQLEQNYVGKKLSSDAIFALKDRPSKPSTSGRARDALAGSQTTASAISELADDTVEAAILDAYLQLRREPRAWLALTDLRAMLPSNLSKSQVDAALVRLARKKGVSLVPATNQKLLRPQDRAAMVRSGNEDKLLFSVDTF